MLRWNVMQIARTTICFFIFQKDEFVQEKLTEWNLTEWMTSFEGMYSTILIQMWGCEVNF